VGSRLYPPRAAHAGKRGWLRGEISHNELAAAKGAASDVAWAAAKGAAWDAVKDEQNTLLELMLNELLGL